MNLSQAAKFVPEFSGNRNELSKFISCGDFAIENVESSYKYLLLEIIKNKLINDAYNIIRFKDVKSWEQLKVALNDKYGEKKNIAHLQLEMSSARQNKDEDVRAYSERLNSILSSLAIQMTENKDKSVKSAIYDVLEQQRHNAFIEGLRQPIKFLMKAKNITIFEDAVEAAVLEEINISNDKETLEYFGLKVKNYREYNNNNYKKDSRPKCSNCHKIGHEMSNCYFKKTSFNKNNFIKKSKDVHVKTIITCHYCGKEGHIQSKCFKKQRDELNKNVMNKPSSKTNENKASNFKTVQVGRVTDDREHECIEMQLSETVNDKVCLLIDTGADISIIKVSLLEDDAEIMCNTKKIIKGISEEPVTTIGTKNLIVTLKDKEIIHPFQVVYDNFPLRSNGILGRDFMSKYKANLDYDKGVLQVENTKWKLVPYINKIMLQPRTETIICTKTQSVGEGVVYSCELQPGVQLGSSLTKAFKGKCLVPVSNTTEEKIEIEIPEVKLEKVNVFKCEKITRNRDEEVIKQLRTEHMNKEERKAIIDICTEYNDLFFLPGDKLTSTSTLEHTIPLKQDTAPINIKPYRIPEQHKNEVQKQIDAMLQQGIIKQSQSPWNAPLIVVPKKLDASGKMKWRICIDFRKLNETTIGNSYPLPNITDILDQLGRSKYFSTLDLSSGFHQINVQEDHKERTAFSTPYGHYEFNRMPFGLKGGPPTFQRLMNTVLSGLQGLKCFVYLDDIVVYANSLTEHQEKLKVIFDRLREHKLLLNADKCEFLRKEVNYLGHVITDKGLAPDPKKTEAVDKYPVPQTSRDIKSFLGLVGYYRKFIKDFSKIAQPLNDLLKKDVPFEWTQKQENSFQTLKSKLTTAPLLQYPNFNEEFVITTDASNVACGAILSQGKIGQDKPISYASRTLNKAEINYSTTEKELAAIVWAVKHFRPYIYGTRFTLVTDHKPLQWLFNVKDPGSRLMRWIIKLADYDFAIVHKSGKKNTNADALSRIEINIAESTKQEEITKEEKKRIIEEYHDSTLGGHQGITRTYNRIKLKYSWPNMRQDIEEYIRKCDSCQRNKSHVKDLKKVPMQLSTELSRPFEQCALDIVGPLPISQNGNKYLLTFQDCFSRYAEAVPIKDQSAETIAREIATNIICRHGAPERLLTDQGTNFVSEVMRSLCKMLKIKKIQTTSYHPQANGSLERSHKTIAEYLRHYVNEDQLNWDLWIPYAIFTFNTTVHTATGYTPFSLIHGREAVLPTSLKKITPEPQYNYDEFKDEVKKRLQSAHLIARKMLHKKKEASKNYYDKSTINKQFVVGDTVLLHDETLRRGRSKKLSPQWIGPYTITQRNSEVNYTIKKGKKLIKVHANRLKKYED